jgi:hypothetical protein
MKFLWWLKYAAIWECSVVIWPGYEAANQLRRRIISGETRL